MICTKCSRQIPDDAVLCCYCGKKYIIDRSKKEKRANGEGSVFKIASGWVAQITVGTRPLPDLSEVDPEDPQLLKKPQQIRRSKYGFKTRAEALAYLPILKAQAGEIRAEAPHLIRYWETYKTGEYDHLSKSKQVAYKGAWEKLKPLHEYRVDAITVSDLRRVVSAKCKTYYTARDCRSVLSALFKLAAAEGYVNKDLPSFIVLPQLEEKEQTPFSETEQKALWKIYEEGDLRAAIPLFMIYTGAMPGETMRLRVNQIDIEHHQITGAGMKTKVRKATPIVLADQIIPLVEDLIAHAQPSGFLWVLDEKVWYADYYAALEAAKCRRLTPYSCRHTTATALAITQGIAPQTVKRVMRWSTTRMLDRYAHPDQADAQAAVNQI
jgi:integrase